jgi:hypothetical protein
MACVQEYPFLKSPLLGGGFDSGESTEALDRLVVDTNQGSVFKFDGTAPLRIRPLPTVGTSRELHVRTTGASSPEIHQAARVSKSSVKLCMLPFNGHYPKVLAYPVGAHYEGVNGITSAMLNNLSAAASDYMMFGTNQRCFDNALSKIVDTASASMRGTSTNLRLVVLSLASSQVPMQLGRWAQSSSACCMRGVRVLTLSVATGTSGSSLQRRGLSGCSRAFPNGVI